jgi:Acetyltransferase (GNAT) domain
MNDWQIRPYQPGDEAGVTALWRDVFGRVMTPERWRWKLKGRPSMTENVWLATAASDGRIVGQYAGIPVGLKVGGTVRDAMVIVDSMTHPDVRRRGILTTLSSVAHEAWASAGVSVVLGLPNDRALLPSRAAEQLWQPLFPLRWLRMPLRFDEIVGRSGRLPRALRPPARAIAAAASAGWRMAWRSSETSPVAVEPVGPGNLGGAGLDELWAAIGPRFPNVLVRDAAWLRWRFLEDPGARYTLLVAREAGIPRGYLAYRISDEGGARRGIIGDLFTAPEDRDAAAALLRVALSELFDAGAGTVVALAAEGSALDRRLMEGRRFRPRPEAFMVDYVPLDAEARDGMVGSGAAWHMTGADFDVV